MIEFLIFVLQTILVYIAWLIFVHNTTYAVSTGWYKGRGKQNYNVNLSEEIIKFLAATQAKK